MKSPLSDRGPETNIKPYTGNDDIQFEISDDGTKSAFITSNGVVSVFDFETDELIYHENVKDLPKG